MPTAVMHSNITLSNMSNHCIYSKRRKLYNYLCKIVVSGWTQKVCGHPIAPTRCACKAKVKMNVLWILKTLALPRFILFFVPLQALMVDMS